MPHVSRFKLSEHAERELVDTLLEGLVRIRDRRLAQQVMEDLFTPTEKIMLGKRVLIAILLQRGYGYRDTMRALKVSPTTVNNIHITLARGGAGFKALYALLDGYLKGRARREAALTRIAQIIDVLRLPAKGSRSDMMRWRRALSRVGEK